MRSTPPSTVNTVPVEYSFVIRYSAALAICFGLPIRLTGSVRARCSIVYPLFDQFGHFVPGPMQSRFDRTDRQMQRVGDFFDAAVVLDIHKHDFAKRFRQLQHFFANFTFVFELKIFAFGRRAVFARSNVFHRHDSAVQIFALEISGDVAGNCKNFRRRISDRKSVV